MELQDILCGQRVVDIQFMVYEGENCGNLGYFVWGDRCVVVGYCVCGDRCGVSGFCVWGDRSGVAG